jgi:two-component system cell cycle sensor histidine kinase/response regulator CckA
MSYKTSLFVGCRKLFTAVSGLLLPPTRQVDEELHSRAILISIFTSLAAFLALVIFISAFLGETNKLASASQAVLIFTLSLVVFCINRKGHPTLAAIIFLVFMWMASTFTILFSGGINGPYNFLYIALIAGSGLILGRRAVWAVIAFVIINGLVIVFLEKALNPLPIMFIGPSLAVWVILSILIILVTVGTQFMQDRASNAFALSIRELEIRKSTERTLVIQNSLMQDINKLGIELAALPSDANLHQFLAMKLKQLSGAALVTFGEYLPEVKAIRMRHIEVDNSLLETLNDRIDTEILSFVSKLNSLESPVPADMSAMILGQVAGYYDTLTETSLGTIPNEISDKVQKVFDIDCYGGIAYSFEGTLYGSSILAYKRGQQKPREELLHAFAALAAVSLRRKRAEDELREREMKYRLLAENVTDVIWTIDMDLKFTYVSPSIYRLRGISVAEALSQSLDVVLTPASLETARNALLEELALESTQGINPTRSKILEFEEYCKDGSTIWTENTLTFLRDNKGKPVGILGVTRDVSERKRAEQHRLGLERQVVQAQKLESLGLLAGGIAHDFNNILTSVLGNISVASMEAAPGSEIQESLKQAEKASLRAKELTQQLLTFSKGGAPIKKLASLMELLKDTAGFALRGSNVKCDFSIPADLWHAEIDTGQVSQVIHNLVINAQQAMPTGGTIELTAKNISPSETRKLGRGLPLKEGNYIRIAVTDHGSGIPAEHLDRIFDPFFTTKRKGSGLGLATSFSIARNHGGHLSVKSEPGSGSTFYLYLPASAETSTSRLDKKEEIKPAGKARILMMDDEKGVREVAGRMLKHIGYKDIEFAADGARAVRLYKVAMASGNPFSLVILDLTIPGGMGGIDTLRELLKIDPGIKAIVSSGYTDQSVMAEYREYGFSGMVAKPYTLDELGKAIYDVSG